MSKVRLIAECGSTHMGKLSRILEAIHRCQDGGIDALKLQLFPNEAPYVPTNIWLDPEIFVTAFNYAKKHSFQLSASCFDQSSYELLKTLNVPFIKLAYGKKEQFSWIADDGQERIVSCDVMTDHLVPSYATKLYCIPEYPVRYEVAFDGLFPRFDGFSDHTMGIRQTVRAIEAGAKVIEKHVRLGYADETCPDARFAVTIEEFAKVRKND